LVSILAESQYETVVDLNDPENPRKLSKDSLLEMAENLDDNDSFTDLFIY
jgi:hypothetical protein